MALHVTANHDSRNVHVRHPLVVGEVKLVVVDHILKPGGHDQKMRRMRRIKLVTVQKLERNVDRSVFDFHCSNFKL